MVTPEVDASSRKNKTVIVVSLIIGVITVVALTIFAVFFFNAPDTTDPDSGNQKGEPIPTSFVPLAEDFSVVQRTSGGLEADYSFTIQKIDNAYIVEYRLEDNQFAVLDSGSLTEPGDVNKAVLLKTTTTSVSLMFRVISGKDASSWVNVGTQTVEVTETSGNTEREVNPAFYDTAWAQKTDVTVGALQEAFIVAFDASPVLPEEYPNCYLGNTATLYPGEIVRPRPELGSQYTLKTYVYQLGNQYKVDFVWCEGQ